ncbi:MAG: hypothetical protein V9E98_09825 [Candidatus Nanopelagicales bacterium]
MVQNATWIATATNNPAALSGYLSEWGSGERLHHADHHGDGAGHHSRAAVA